MSKPIRVFMFNWREEHLPLAEKMAKSNIDIVYWAWSGEDEESWTRLRAIFPNIIIHSYNKEIFRFLPARGVDPSQFPPPGQQLLARLAECESEVMTMMTRMDYSWSGMPIHLRKKLYYEMVRYWDGVVQMFKPDCVIHSHVPHNGGSDYVLYCLCQLYQIKQFFFQFTFIGSRSLIFDNREEGCIPLRLELNKNKYKNIGLDELDDDIRSEYIKQTDKNQDSTPVFMKELIDKHSRRKEASEAGGVLRFIGNTLRVITNSFYQRPQIVAFQDMGRTEYLMNLARWKLHQQRLQHEYNKLAQEDSALSEPYVYFPLQYQPEASSSPLGGVFVDQLIVAKILSHCVPPGWQIYVKEHAYAQWFFDMGRCYRARPLGYYRAIAELPNVKIVSTELSTFELIASSRAVATCTGTAAWEAVCRGIPALVFGYPWFMDCPGMFRVQEVDTCRDILSSIKEGKVIIDQQDIVDYLYAFGRHSIREATDSSELEGTGVTVDESLNSVFESIIDELESI